MPGQVIGDLLNANIENVRKGALPYIFQRNSDYAVQRVCKNSESNRITKTTNGADFRAPIMLAPPGVFGAANLDGGPLGLGVGLGVSQFLQTYFQLKMGFQLSWAAVKGTETRDQSRVQLFQTTMELGLPNFARYEDASWHNLGGQDGQWGIVTAVSGASPGAAGTFTLDADLGVRLGTPGMRFEILDTTGTTWKTGQSGVSPDNLPYINPGALNYQGRTFNYTCPVTLTAGNVPAVGDLLYFKEATPAGVPTWLQGLRYVNTTATSGSYLGLSRTTYPVINSSAITSGGSLSPAQVLALTQLVRIRAGNSQSPDFIGLVDPHQIAVMNATVQAMQVFFRNQVTEKQLDPLPSVQLDGGIIWGAVTHYYDAMQSASRIDYCNTNDWGRVYLDDKPGADFYRDRNGDMFFPQYSVSGSIATPATSDLFYLVSTMNYYNINPQNSGLITNLTPPATDYNY